MKKIIIAAAAFAALSSSANAGQGFLGDLMGALEGALHVPYVAAKAPQAAMDAPQGSSSDLNYPFIKSGESGYLKDSNGQPVLASGK